MNDFNKVMMALNTRGAYNDIFWFGFFHELKHVLQKENKIPFSHLNRLKEKYEINIENQIDLIG